MTTVRRSDYLSLVVMRLCTVVVAVAALALPPGAPAQAQDTLHGSIAGLTFPLRLNSTFGPSVTHLPPGSDPFSLVDNARTHSIHVIGPLDRPGVPPGKVNFGTAVPTARTFPSHRQRLRNGTNVPLEHGLYRLFCDLHGDLMNSFVPVGNYLWAEVGGRPGGASRARPEWGAPTAAGSASPMGARPSA